MTVQRTRGRDDQIQQYAKGELDQAKGDGETILDMIIKNAREGRFGSSKLTDPEKLEAGVSSAGGGGIKPAAKGGIEAARTEISRTRTEVNAVAGPGDSGSAGSMGSNDSGASDAQKTLDQLNDTLSSNRTLLRHV